MRDLQKTVKFTIGCSGGHGQGTLGKLSADECRDAVVGDNLHPFQVDAQWTPDQSAFRVRQSINRLECNAQKLGGKIGNLLSVPCNAQP